MVRTPPGSAGRLVGVGVGPGDPDLVTRRAVAVLNGSTRVVAPTTASDSVGRAEAIVRQACPDLAERIVRLVFDMAPDGLPGGPAARAASHRRAAESLLPWLDAGEQVAFVTLGDPNIFSTFSSLAGELLALRPDVELETVPGITAFQALAASSGTPLLDGTERLRLVTALDGTADVADALLDRESAIVIYKGGRYLPDIARLLGDAGRLPGAVAGELLGLPGERIAAVEASSPPASYLATVIVPPLPRRPKDTP